MQTSYVIKILIETTHILKLSTSLWNFCGENVGEVEKRDFVNGELQKRNNEILK